MRVFDRPPHPRLRSCIDRFWGWECDPGEAVALPLLLPGTGAEMFFHHGTPFAGEAQPSQLLCLRRRPLRLAAPGGIGFVAVRIRAGRLGRLTTKPARECLDRQLSAEALWGDAGRALAQRVAAAPAFGERVDLLEDFFLHGLPNGHADDLVEEAVERLYRDPLRTDIAGLADALGIGRRQLERRFLRQEGISPAAFRSVTRFQKTARRLLLDPALPLLDAALAQGYCDQAHFCRDFKFFSGQSPGRHLAAARRTTHFYNTSRA